MGIKNTIRICVMYSWLARGLTWHGLMRIELPEEGWTTGGLSGGTAEEVEVEVEVEVKAAMAHLAGGKKGKFDKRSNV